MSVSVIPEAAEIFDRRLLRRRRDRAAAGFADHAFLFERAARELADRLEDVTRRFERGLVLGARDGRLARFLPPGKVARLVQADLSPTHASQAGGVCVDEEWLPFATGAFDLVLAPLALHWVNDVPGALAQLRRCLRPDGLLLAMVPGSASLQELRACLIEAESRVLDGISPRTSPAIDAREAGGLLQRAGFALPVVDSAEIIVTYPDAFRLMAELRALGAANALKERHRRLTPRALFVEAAQLYQARFGDGEGGIEATVELITLTGWAPSDTQQKPLRPGSAATRLADALGTVERDAGDTVG